MNKDLLSALAAVGLTFGIATTANAFELGNTGISLPQEVEASYNVETQKSTIMFQSGVSYSMWGITASADADFDVIETEYKGLDFGIDYRHPAVPMALFEIDTGLDTDQKMEDIVLSVTLNF